MNELKFICPYCRFLFYRDEIQTYEGKANYGQPVRHKRVSDATKCPSCVNFLKKDSNITGGK